MVDYALPIQIIASVLALSASYGAVMVILKRELEITFLRYEVMLALASGVVATAFAFSSFDIVASVAHTSSFIFLGLATVATLTLLIYMRFKLSGKEVAEPQQKTARTLSIVAFTGFLLHLLLELVAFAWF